MDQIKIIVPHEGVNEIPKGYKPLMTSDGKLVSIVPEDMTKNDAYWIKTERIVPVIDWEQRQYELAKAAMQGMLSNASYDVYDNSFSNANTELIASSSIKYADEMIRQLKECQFSLMGSVNRLIESVKSGDRPSFTGFYLNESQLEELRPYVDNEYYATVLKARLEPGKFIVCINGPRLSFLCSGEGDPPRTLLRNRAKIFPTRERAEMAIDKAKLTHPQKEREYFVDEL